MSDKGDVFDHYRYSDKSGVRFFESYIKGDNTLKWTWMESSDFQDVSEINRAQQPINVWAD